MSYRNVYLWLATDWVLLAVVVFVLAVVTRPVNLPYV